MDIQAFVVWFLTVCAISDGFMVYRPARRLKLNRRNKNVGSPKTSLTHNINIRNLPLAPGQSKVIRQTLLVRRRGGPKPRPASRPASRNGASGSKSRPLVLIRPTILPSLQPRTQVPFSGNHGNGAPRRSSLQSIATLNLPVININQLGHVLSSRRSNARALPSRGVQSAPVNSLAQVDLFISDLRPHPTPTGHPNVGGASRRVHSNVNIATSGINSQSGPQFVRVRLGNGREIIYTAQSSIHPQPTVRSRTRRTTVNTLTGTFPTTLKAGEDPPESQFGAGGQEVEI